MVGHDHRGMELQADAVEAGQTPTHDFTNGGLGENAATVPGIEPLLHPFTEAGFALAPRLDSPWLGILPEPHLLISTELGEFGPRQRVSQAEVTQQIESSRR